MALPVDFWMMMTPIFAGIGMDTCVIPLRHGGLSLVQTTDYIYPIVDDPYMMVSLTDVFLHLELLTRLVLGGGWGFVIRVWVFLFSFYTNCSHPAPALTPVVVDLIWSTPCSHLTPCVRQAGEVVGGASPAAFVPAYVSVPEHLGSVKHVC